MFFGVKSKQKKEALYRMKKLEIREDLISNFDDGNYVSVIDNYDFPKDNPTTVRGLNNKERELIYSFQKNTSSLVFLVIRTHVRSFNILIERFLFVSSNIDWTIEHKELECYSIISFEIFDSEHARMVQSLIHIKDGLPYFDLASLLTPIVLYD